MKIVMLNAERVHTYGCGVVGLEIPTHEMTEEDRDALSRLSPNLQDRVYQLLDQESLLASLFTGSLPNECRVETHETTKIKAKAKGWDKIDA